MLTLPSRKGHLKSSILDMGRKLEQMAMAALTRLTEEAQSIQSEVCRLNLVFYDPSSATSWQQQYEGNSPLTSGNQVALRQQLISFFCCWRLCC